MMFVLTLDLPFDIMLVHRQLFKSEVEAAEFAKGYPQYVFKPTPVTEVGDKCILVPLNPIKIEEK